MNGFETENETSLIYNLHEDDYCFSWPNVLFPLGKVCSLMALLSCYVNCRMNPTGAVIHFWYLSIKLNSILKHCCDRWRFDPMPSLFHSHSMWFLVQSWSYSWSRWVLVGGMIAQSFRLCHKCGADGASWIKHHLWHSFG